MIRNATQQALVAKTFSSLLCLLLGAAAITLEQTLGLVHSKSNVRSKQGGMMRDLLIHLQLKETLTDNFSWGRG